MSFKDWKIGARLGLGSALTLVLLVAVATVGYLSLNSTWAAMEGKPG